MPSLVRGDDVLTSAEVATSFAARLRGLLGRRGVDGALVIRPARSVHTLGMRFPIDVAFCAVEGPSLVVVDTVTMRPHRLGRARRRCAAVIEAEAGAFARWGLAPGDHLEVRP